MPIYEYGCFDCNYKDAEIRPVDNRDDTKGCPDCGRVMVRLLGAPRFRFAGQITPGGGPDRFTADMLGIPLKELPSGLRTPM